MKEVQGGTPDQRSMSLLAQNGLHPHSWVMSQIDTPGVFSEIEKTMKLMMSVVEGFSSLSVKFPRSAECEQQVFQSPHHDHQQEDAP